jgi:hypothetical protein
VGYLESARVVLGSAGTKVQRLEGWQEREGRNPLSVDEGSTKVQRLQALGCASLAS